MFWDSSGPGSPWSRGAVLLVQADVVLRRLLATIGVRWGIHRGDERVGTRDLADIESFSTMVIEFKCSTRTPETWFVSGGCGSSWTLRVNRGDVSGWLPLKAVLPMPGEAYACWPGLAPVDVFKVLVGPEFFLG